MKLTLQDRVALIYSAQGSQRATARELGLSHQIVGRILRAGGDGGYSLNSKRLSDPTLKQTVNNAFARHKKLVQAQAKRDGLPYDPQVPIFVKRLEYQPWDEKPTGRLTRDKKTGEIKLQYKRVPMVDKQGAPVIVKGDRVLGDDVHWLRDAVKYEWVARMHGTGFYYAASVGSIVNIQIYNRQAELRENMANYNPEKAAHALSILKTIEDNIVNARIFTRVTEMGGRGSAFSAANIIRDIDSKLRQKHQPATGSRGTRLADQLLMQVDNQNDDAKRFRAKQQIPPKQRKARKT